MDELVFQRENLRRRFLTLADHLDHAGKEYNPEEVLPVFDMIFILMISSGLGGEMVSYLKALRDHGNTIAAAKGEEPPDVLQTVGTMIDSYPGKD